MIVVADYDPAWAGTFEALRAEYAAALDAAGVAFVGIEHVGSTAVPGLAAKPIIDCDVIVEPADMDRASKALEGIGFVPRGDLGLPGRLAFFAPDRLPATNTYVVDVNSLQLRNHLAVRDVLRTNPDLRDAYASVKRSLVNATDDIEVYVAGKSDVLQQVLEVAGMSEDDRVELRAANRAALDKASANQPVVD